MRPLAVTDVIRTLLATAAATILSGVPAKAAPITLNFTGTVDLSPVGGPVFNTYSGFITWESTAVPFETEPGFAT
jgi:hypothetical protein